MAKESSNLYSSLELSWKSGSSLQDREYWRTWHGKELTTQVGGGDEEDQGANEDGDGNGDGIK